MLRESWDCDSSRQRFLCEVLFSEDVVVIAVFCHSLKRPDIRTQYERFLKNDELWVYDFLKQSYNSVDMYHVNVIRAKMSHRYGLCYNQGY